MDWLILCYDRSLKNLYSMQEYIRIFWEEIHFMIRFVRLGIYRYLLFSWHLFKQFFWSTYLIRFSFFIHFRVIIMSHWMWAQSKKRIMWEFYKLTFCDKSRCVYTIFYRPKKERNTIFPCYWCKIGICITPAIVCSEYPYFFVSKHRVFHDSINVSPFISDIIDSSRSFPISFIWASKILGGIERLWTVLLSWISSSRI